MTRKQMAAQKQHDKFLKSMGVHPEQLKATKPSRRRGILKNYFNVADSYYAQDDLKKLAVDGTDIGTRKGIMANLHREPEHVQKQIMQKAKQVGIAYNKGGYQFITDKEQVKFLGKK